MIVLKTIAAIVFGYFVGKSLYMTPREKAIQKAKKEGKSWTEIYHEFYIPSETEEE